MHINYSKNRNARFAPEMINQRGYVANNPLVTVLMAVYNGESHLGAAIQSILDQTYTNFEFIIIDDASTDNSRILAESYNDPRILILSNSHNMRLAGSLNRGIIDARGKYIARMDADDISLPHRLEKQVAFMEGNPHIGVSGSWLECFGDKNQIWEYPSDPQILQCSMLFQNQMGHPSIIMRRDLMIAKSLFYDADFLEAEDYDLWIRCSRHFSLANLAEVLLLYRWHEKQASQANLAKQLYYHTRICRSQLERLGLHPSDEEMRLHMEISLLYSEVLDFELDTEFLTAARLWLLKIMEANLLYPVYSQTHLCVVLENRWRNICITSGINYVPLSAY
ncbi:MAG: glycosyltransferase family A protein [Syntrophomonas sp.]